MSSHRTPDRLRLDEKSHVEEPFLQQLDGLGWTIKRLDIKQVPQDSFRQNFNEVVLLPVLKESLLRINPWLEEDQIHEVIRRITSFSRNALIENNKQVFDLLLENTSVSEDRKTNDRSPTVKYVDFIRPENNSFIAISQFKVRVLGTEHNIYPDITLFLNGLPVCVIECKSPKVKEPIPEAIDQLLRYSEQRGEEKEGNQSLFFYNQFIIATCRQEAKFGTITTHTEKLFFRWTDPYPKTVDEIRHGSSSPNDQERLVAGMLDKENLLSIIHTFTIFSASEKGKTIKIVGRYQQFRAVKKSVKRLLEGKNKEERGGIIWHTQGSGKSLTMMFMVREMYHHDRPKEFKIVFITDRTQLEDQLNKTSRSSGFKVKVADSIARLKELLRNDSSDLVMAMIHKFQEHDLRETFPVLNESAKILIMTDEAHRSQFKLLGANLDRALPNATKIGYTGTPTDRTERTFGEYIDKYTMRQSIDDKVTLEIVYEGRNHTACVKDDKGLDVEFFDVFSDYSAMEKLQILGYGSRDAYLEAKETIKAKACDMVRHYVEQVFPNGFKAQVVAPSREGAVRYKEYLDEALKNEIEELKKANPLLINIDRLAKLKTAVIISGSHNDLPHINEHTNSDKHKTQIDSFKLGFDESNEGISGDIGILIVFNMLITGFDAPVEQVMYLDRVITDHNLLQAIARVNRVGPENKNKGFVVDYVGIGNNLKQAIDSYDEREQAEILDVLGNGQQELNNLIAAHRELWELLKKSGLTDLSDHDAFFDLFYDEDIRFDFIIAFKKFARCLDLLFPQKEALDYLQDFYAFSEINVMAAKHFRDARLSMKSIPDKLRAITDKYLISRGIDQKVAPISIIDEKFLEHVKKHKRTKTKSAEIEHAIRNFIDIHMDDDPELYASFADAIDAILLEFKNNWEEIFRQFNILRQKILNASREPTYGLHRKKQMPFFRIFKKEFFGDKELSEDEIEILVRLTQNIFETIATELNLTGFWNNIPSQNRLKGEIQKIVLSEEFNGLPDIFQKRQQIITRVMELAERNNDTVLYAE